MKRREQALLLLRKAAQDEALLDQALTPFGAIYSYDDDDAPLSLDRIAARGSLRQLRLWVESRLQERTPPTVE